MASRKKQSLNRMTKKQLLYQLRKARRELRSPLHVRGWKVTHGNKTGVLMDPSIRLPLSDLPIKSVEFHAQDGTHVHIETGYTRIDLEVTITEKN